MADWLQSGNWVPVGLGSGLKEASVQRAMVSGHDLAIWRGRDGEARAWENRCPHRGMRLSFGFVRENRLTCLYHGWTYDGTGSCVAIPAHPALTPPKTIKVQTFACAEFNGLIWVAPERPTGEPPSIAGQWLDCRSIAIDAPVDQVREALSTAVFPPFTTSETAAGSPEAPAEAAEEKRYSVRWADREIAYSTRFASASLAHLRAGNGEEMLCGIQSVSSNSTSLHILISVPSVETDFTEARLHYANWAKRFRLFLESGEVAQSGYHPWLAAA